MASSRASTTAGRRRSAERTARARARAPRAAAPRPAAPRKPDRHAPRTRKPGPKAAPSATKASKSRKAPKSARTPKAATARKGPKESKAQKALRARKATRQRTAPPARPTGGRLAGLLRARTLLVAGVIVLALAAGYQFWLRDSALVAVGEVSVSGISGPEEEMVVGALTEAAGTMTTLNVDEEALGAAVAGFPTVVGVSADADFPHGLAITVSERPPVLMASSEQGVVPVAGDGTLLNGVDASELKLPTITLAEPPAAGKLEGDALEMALVMGGAPEPLRGLAREISVGGDEGVQVVLKGGVPVYFGAGEKAGQKWSALAAVLADPEIETLTYVDVRVPARPAVGGAAPAMTESTTETVTAVP